jgi:hypothetical protein
MQQNLTPNKKFLSCFLMLCMYICRETERERERERERRSTLLIYALQLDQAALNGKPAQQPVLPTAMQFRVLRTSNLQKSRCLSQQHAQRASHCTRTRARVGSSDLQISCIDWAERKLHRALTLRPGIITSPGRRYSLNSRVFRCVTRFSSR